MVQKFRATKFCTDSQNILGPSSHPSIALKFEIAPAFLEHLCTLIIIQSVY